jgi:hypothetical protein
MPKTAIDYSKTIIYKIVCNDLTITDLYVGQTTDFIRRRYQHKGHHKNTKLGAKIYQTIRDNGGWENWSMIQIEEYPCENGNEARARERYWFEQLQANLNLKCPNRSQEEYVELNKDKIKERQKAYNEENRDERNRKKRIFYQKNIDKIKEHKLLNKDKIKEQQSQPYNCECGSIVRICVKLRHFRSKKHQEFIAQKDNTDIKI